MLSDQPSEAGPRRQELVLLERTVLVVDDDPVMVKLYSAALGSRGASVVVSGSAEHALELLADAVFDLIIVDKQLPGLSGDDLVRSLRELDANDEQPIVMVSGHADVAERIKSYDAGVTDYVTKPVSMTELLAKVTALLQHGDALRHAVSASAKLELDSMRDRLEGRAWVPYFQPIVRLHDLAVIGYEAVSYTHLTLPTSDLV